MKRLLILLLVGPAVGRAQSLSVSPSSVGLWGTAPHTIKLAGQYKHIEAVFLYARKSLYDAQGAAYSGGFFGIFYTPVNLSWWRLGLHGGAGYFFRKFPTIHGTHLNFTAELEVRVTARMRLKYGHISNGFGLLNDLNPGIDNIGIAVSLTK